MWLRMWKLRVRVYYEDTDVGGVVYYANYLKFCERARSELFFNKSLTPIDNGCHFVVKDLKASYFKPAKFADILEIKTTPLEIRKASIVLLQEVLKDEDIIFEMQIELVFLCGEKISKIPKEFVGIFKN